MEFKGKGSLSLSLKKAWIKELRTLIKIKLIMVMMGDGSSPIETMAITDIMLIRILILIRKRLFNRTKVNTKPYF